jgi:hypothetical protein
VPVGPNHVASLTAIDSVPTVAIAHIYEIAPLLGVHYVAVTINQLGQNIVGASGADDALWYLKSLAAVSALVGTVCS